MSEDKYLRIVEMLAGVGPNLASRITKELRVSGRDVGKARRLLGDGFITFGEDCKPYYAKHMEAAERFFGSSVKEGMERWLKE